VAHFSKQGLQVNTTLNEFNIYSYVFWTHISFFLFMQLSVALWRDPLLGAVNAGRLLNVSAFVYKMLSLVLTVHM
jgi:hypothetical protein